MKCTNCGQEGYSLTVFVNMSSMKTDYICSRCQAIGMAKRVRSLKKIDTIIAEFEEMGKRMEEMILEFPEMPEVPKPLQNIAHTPVTAYKDIQVALVELKSRRLEILIKKGSEARMKYELKKALEEEDYEKSAELRDKLNKEGKKTGA